MLECSVWYLFALVTTLSYGISTLERFRIIKFWRTFFFFFPSASFVGNVFDLVFHILTFTCFLHIPVYGQLASYLRKYSHTEINETFSKQ